MTSRATDRSDVMGDRLSHWDARRSRIALEIEQAALELFVKRDPDSVTVDEIAEAAGISRRTLFRYFQSRDDILTATPARSLAEGINAIRQRPVEETLIEALLASSSRQPTSREESHLFRLSGKVMNKEPVAWERALARLRQQTDHIFIAMVRDRLEAQGRDSSGAAIIGSALAAIVIEVHREWTAASGEDSFRDRLARAIEQLQSVICC